MREFLAAGGGASALAAIMGVVKIFGSHAAGHAGRLAKIWLLPDKVDALATSIDALAAEMRGAQAALTSRIAVDETALYQRTGGTPHGA